MDYPIDDNLSSSSIDDSTAEILSLENKLLSSSVPNDLKEESMLSVNRLKRMIRMGGYSSEFETVNKYIDWIVRIPWTSFSEDRFDIHEAREIMDSTHYGMESVKNLILDYLASMELKQKNYSSRLNIPTQFQITNENITERPSVNIQNKKTHTPVFLFVGLQGVGKTSIARSIAQSMNRKFARISLGAIGDVRTLRGTPRYSVDGEPGQIVKSLIRCGTMNPVILLDEIEKSSGNVGLLSDVMATLLEILDPEQNATFVDHYIDHPIDLSNVMFICTANNLGGLSAALLDRVEVIRFTSYSDEEKEVIAKQYILPGVLEEYSLTPDQIQISDDIWISVIRPVGFDAGIRQLERNIATMIRSVARKIVEGESTPIIINKENLSDFLNVDQGPLS
ncbi:MAG TPA: AAA family ATPase [Candidatus Dojkabacteria bacterium]|nr:AAA family ATPase [Candidatus Dojkabacteria bacterium]